MSYHTPLARPPSLPVREGTVSAAAGQMQAASAESLQEQRSFCPLARLSIYFSPIIVLFRQ